MFGFMGAAVRRRGVAIALVDRDRHLHAGRRAGADDRRHELEIGERDALSADRVRVVDRVEGSVSENATGAAAVARPVSSTGSCR
jgi:hypothetical protein